MNLKAEGPHRQGAAMTVGTEVGEYKLLDTGVLGPVPEAQILEATKH